MVGMNLKLCIPLLLLLSTSCMGKALQGKDIVFKVCHKGTPLYPLGSLEILLNPLMYKKNGCATSLALITMTYHVKGIVA